MSDLREAKAAATSHNMASCEPPSTSAAVESRTEGSPAQTSDKPALELEGYIPPPPPPKNLPHGWTARYDEKEGRFLYSRGVDASSEQRDFPTERNTEGSTATGNMEQVTAKPT